MTQSPQERGSNGPIFIRQQNIPDQGLIQTLAQAASEVLIYQLQRITIQG